MAGDNKNGFPFPKGGMAEMFGGMRMPAFDMEAMMSLARRNMEALAEANRLAAEGMQAIARRQAEIVRDTVNDMRGGATEMMAEGQSGGISPRHADLAKKSLETAMANARELSEMSVRAQQEILDMLGRRMLESIDEMQKLVPGK